MEKLNEAIEYFFPPGVPVVFLHAHPDDECFLTAGLLQEFALKRTCVLIFCAAALVPGQSDTWIRHEELRRASKILGVDHCVFLPFSEPKYLGKGGAPLMGASIREISDELFACLEREAASPCILVSYDKNGGYGNGDHKIVHLAGRAAFAARPDVVTSLFEVTLNRQKVKKWLGDAKGRLPSESIPKLSYWSSEFGLSKKEITHRYKLTEKQCVLKRQALVEYASQMGGEEFPLSLTSEDFHDFFSEEFLAEVKPQIQAGTEIERKFLIRSFPVQFADYPVEKIRQGYISSGTDGTEERVREKDGVFFHTFKHGSGLLRMSEDQEIDRARFEFLWSKTQDRRIDKSRYRIPYGDVTIELDVFHGAMAGLLVAEVEFSSESSARCFSPPDWFGSEVTDDVRYKNQQLALMLKPPTF